MWPMLGALSDFLDSREIGSFVYPNGKIESWRLSKEDSAEKRNSHLATAPVAVLIGRQTASAGEATAIAFKGREDTLFFGSETFGQTSGNKEYSLPDGSEIVLAVARARDRNGNIYNGSLRPDVEVSSNDLVAAKAWLRRYSNASPSE